MLRKLLTFCILFVSCATSPLIRERSRCQRVKAVIIHSKIAGYSQRYTIVQTEEGIRHLLQGNWGVPGDTFIIELKK